MTKLNIDNSNTCGDCYYFEEIFFDYTGVCLKNTSDHYRHILAKGHVGCEFWDPKL